MQKRSRIVIAVSALVIIICGLYIALSHHYRNVYLPRTNVAGVNVGGKTAAQANQLLKTHFKRQKFTIIEGSKKLTQFTGQDAGVTPKFKQNLVQLKQQQNPWAWPLQLLTGTSTTEASKSLTVNQTTFNQFFKQTAQKLNHGRQLTQNATVIKKAGSFKIKAAVNGNHLDEQKLRQTIRHGLAATDGQIQVNTTYKKPSVTASDQNLAQAVDKLKQIHQEKITYTINGHKLTVPQNTIYTWETFKAGKVTLDTDQVQQYIASLNKNYATIIKDRQFKSTKRGTVKVPAGTYGWSIKTNSEVAALTREVLKGKDFTREPITQGSGYSTSKKDIGDTYIEVDKTNQHMWYYKDGQSVIDTDIVTGKPKQETPSGVFFVWNKQRNATLRGENDNGTNYASPVSYWMPIDYTGVGIHDASWQPKFGGTWYKNHGSHGCINTPPSTMAKLYNAVTTGTPVIVF